MKKSKKIIKINTTNIKKLRIIQVTFFIFFVLLIGRLIYLQFVEGNKLGSEANSRQTATKTIEPVRGTIYDSNGKALAVSAEVDTVSVNPSKLKYSNNKDVPFELVAQGFSDIFGLEYNEVLEKLESANSYVTIASKVESDKIDLLNTWIDYNNISSGINIESSKKRYYPYNNLACHMIGFTRNRWKWIVWSGKFLG